MLQRVGRYQTVRVIASGGMATVYLARALGAGGFERLFAIKILHPHMAQEQEFVDMFLDEARLAARIRHPNVVATIDISMGEDGLFLVMDYIEGGSLHGIFRELRKRSRIVPIDIALRIFLDVLAGLHAAHELTSDDGAPLNLVHRDVSPQNILVGVDGVTRITDFGIARAESRITSTRGGQVKGKLGYMAPEQIRSEPIDRRCDIYAAGVVLWEMLTGRRALTADNDGALVAKILTGITESSRKFNPNVPVALDAACMRALSVPPYARYATASDFGDALERAAFDARVPLATPRAVSAFLKSLDLGESIATGTSTNESARRSSASARSAHSVPPRPRSGDLGLSTVPPASGASSTSVGILAQSIPPAPLRSRIGLLALLTVLGVAIGAAAFFVLRPRAHRADASEHADSVPPAVETAVAGTDDTAAAAPPSAPASATSPASVEPNPGGSSVAPAARGAASPKPAPQPRTGGAAPKPAPKSDAPTPPSSPTSYRPAEL